MTDETKQKLKYWFIGLFTGGVVAAPITAVICKNIYESKLADEVAKAADEGEMRGMNAMAEYAVQQQSAEKKYVEEDYAEKVSNKVEPIDPNEYDISIPDSEEDMRDEEAHQRYLDMIDKYTNNDEISPHIISAEKFINEQYMTKSNVNWYEADDVFEEDLVVIQDPFLTFGVTSGRDLFANAEERFDPDIVYVRNERMLTDFEISRIHGSYAEIVGGEAGLGETDT